MERRFSKQYLIPHPRGVVHDAWLSTEVVIEPTERLEIEPMVGGVYRLIMPGGFAMNGRFLEVDPGVHVRYTWQWSGDDEVTEVDVRFADHAQGTEVTINHGPFRSETSYGNHASGWDAYVTGFSAYLAAAG